MLKILSILLLINSSWADYSLDEKIGQMILVGFRGSEVDANHQIIEDIHKYKIGSVILFDYDVTLESRKRNIINRKQVKDLTKRIQRESEIPLLITVDQEGGLVQRLKQRHGFNKVLSPEKVGKRNNLNFTYKESKKLAQDLESVGINLNFAPSADVNTNPDNPVIGKIERSYSSDPLKVSNNVAAFIKSHHDLNIGTTIKHFPGHGSSRGDSHKGFVDVTDTWSEIELIPFKNMINQGNVDILMSAHIFNGSLDPYYPGTLSKSILDDLLRTELKYDGVIISDDMNMSAITDHYGFERAIELAINAGIDILLYGNNLVYDKEIAKRVHTTIKKLLNEERVTIDQINKSFNRVMNLKKKLKVIDKFKSVASTNKSIRKIANKTSILDSKERDEKREIFKKIKKMEE
ncbi:putative sugar hydrolase [Halobacteriovorax marinus SJ]|uniref:beta-N-acetylhexosaminidase n=1 Tax=Halobacteriovorax marinus (strain ATCC BAA-682 / DSM 15412 / SJ) TaxID=862908 RepID=E1X5D7_HALMS|nr:glycoside hydrolase family 3 protein [Halobacteriovorax marinus]CBW27258.1 putative sugar hydrolase [Halobacteriovorax marinus SJ]